MSNENFIDEVDEQLKFERISNFIKRFGWPIVIILLGCGLVLASWRIYGYWQDQSQKKLGDEFIAALDAASSADFSQALQKLNNIEAAKFGSYGDLARLRKASVLQKHGDIERAKQTLLTVLKNSASPAILKDIARLKLAYLLVDAGDIKNVSEMLGPFLKDGSPFQLLAWEALGFAYLKQNDITQAKNYFAKILEQDKTSSDIARRASMISTVLASH